MLDQPVAYATGGAIRLAPLAARGDPRHRRSSQLAKSGKPEVTRCYVSADRVRRHPVPVAVREPGVPAGELWGLQPIATD